MIRARSMSSDRSLPGLGAQLRASAHEPEDHAAAELRARLRNKMFGVGVPVLGGYGGVAAPGSVYGITLRYIH